VAFAALGWLLYQLQPTQAQNIERQLQRALDLVEREALFMTGVAANSAEWREQRHPFFLVSPQGDMLAWSRHRFISSEVLASATHSYRLLEHARGQFLIKKWNAPAGILLIAYPLAERYRISNQYLKPTVQPEVPALGSARILMPGSEKTPISYRGQVVFEVDQADEKILGTGAIACLMLGMCAIVFAVYQWLRQLVKAHRPQLGFAALLMFVLLIRGALSWPNFRLLFPKSNLLDPQVFASSALSPSLFDLLINTFALVALCAFLFFNYSRFYLVQRLSKAAVRSRWLLVTCLASLFFLATLLPFLFVETLVHNSNIVLTISQSITFPVTRIVSFGCVVLGCMSAFMLLHVIVQCCHRGSTSRLQLTLGFVFGAGLFVVYAVLAGKNYWMTLVIGLFYALVVVAAGMRKKLRVITTGTFAYLVTAACLLSLHNTVAVWFLSEEKQVDRQLQRAGQLLVGRDGLSEFLFQESVERAATDPLLLSFFTSPVVSKASVIQKIERVYLSKYLGRFDTDIFFFDASGRSLDGDTTDFFSRLSSYQQQNNSTGYAGVYYVQSAQGPSRYVLVVPVLRQGRSLGFVLVFCQLKKVIPEAVFPSLLVDQRLSEASAYSSNYAFFTGTDIAVSQGSFDYARQFDSRWLAKTNTVIRHDGYLHAVAIANTEASAVVISEKHYTLLDGASDFSFWIAIALLLLLLLFGIAGLVRWARGVSFAYSHRVQWLFYLAILLPLFSVAGVSWVLVSQLAKEQVRGQFEDVALSMAASLSGVLSADSLVAQRERLQLEADRVAQLSKTDVTIYDLTGAMLLATQPRIFSEQLMSRWADRNAWHAIALDGQPVFVQEEKIGSLPFNHVYAPLRHPKTNVLLGAVSVPYFDSQKFVEASQRRLLVVILITFVVTVLIFFVVTRYLLSSLLMPLRMMARTLRETSLNEENRQVKWAARDEIGLMINSYNRMVENLKQSTQALLRSEKESVWREMAQRVAHEIKNPLTPMKLILQRLELSLARGERVAHSAELVKTLLNQIDILNGIASSFSAFARLPVPALQPVDVNAVARQVAQLHNQPGVALKVRQFYSEPAWVHADEALMVRIMSNLVLNSVQAASSSRPLVIEIAISHNGEFYQIEIADNGNGMNPEQQHRAFEAHFTTKQDGSGLGLAIAKHGIEQFGGKIWLTSQEGVGTTFYIVLPVFSSE
jgi:signal transduction histidine kinase